MNWYFNDQGQAKGPQDEQQMGALLNAGTISLKTLVWQIDLPAWQEMGKLPVNWDGPPASMQKEKEKETPGRRTVPNAPSSSSQTGEGGGLLKKLFGFGKK